MKFNDVIRKRTAIRKCSNKKISQKDIEKILTKSLNIFNYRLHLSSRTNLFFCG